jgi:hypothetical protein
MTRERKPSDKLRDQERPEVFGFELDPVKLTPVRGKLDTTTPVQRISR